PSSPSRYRPPFPTRRSSDLILSASRMTVPVSSSPRDGSTTRAFVKTVTLIRPLRCGVDQAAPPSPPCVRQLPSRPVPGSHCSDQDRKSTRLNSSHVKISYAV